jgi:hypothetical protein
LKQKDLVVFSIHMQLSIVLSGLIVLAFFITQRRNQKQDHFPFAPSCDEMLHYSLSPKIKLDDLGYQHKNLITSISGKLTNMPEKIRQKKSINDSMITEFTSEKTIESIENQSTITVIIKPNHGTCFLGQQLYHLAQVFNLSLNGDNQLTKTHTANNSPLYNITPINTAHGFNTHNIFKVNYKGLRVSMKLDQKNCHLSLKQMLVFCNYATKEYDALLYNEHQHPLDKTIIAAWFTKLEEPCLQTQ